MFELYKVKSFSENFTQGNLAGVVLNAQFLSEADMQNISAQVGASETSFVLPSLSADIRVRWFTPNTEVGMCVHATIAALGVLRMRNELPSDTIKVETKNTELLCQFRGNNVFIRVPGYHQVSHKLNILQNLPLFPLKITQVIGSPSVVKNFDDYELVIEVDSFDSLQNLKPEQGCYTEICSAFGVTGISIFTRETMDEQNHIHTREFAPLYGYLEDPLCGMAAGAIFAHIKANETLRVEQGHFCGTSGVITVEPETIDTVWIGGPYCVIQNDAAN